MMIVEFPTQTTTDDTSFPEPEPFFRGVVPLPPSTNMGYKVIMTAESTRVGPTAALQQFKHDSMLMLSQAYYDWSLINAIRDSKKKTPLAVRLHAYMQSEWKRDLDGVIKYVIDAVFDRMQLNDNQVVLLIAEKHVDQIGDPRVELEVRCFLR